MRKRSQQLRFADLPRAPRMPHLNSHQEKEMRVLAAGLQQPLHPTSGNQDDPVSALTELNSLRSLQGGPLVGPADRMRLQNLQVPNLLPLAESWLRYLSFPSPFGLCINIFQLFGGGFWENHSSSFLKVVPGLHVPGIGMTHLCLPLFQTCVPSHCSTRWLRLLGFGKAPEPPRCPKGAVFFSSSGPVPPLITSSQPGCQPHGCRSLQPNHLQRISRMDFALPEHVAGGC